MNLERQSFDIDEPQAGPSWAPKNWPQIDSDDLTAALDPQQMQVAVKAAKECVNRSYETTLREGLQFERRLFHALFSTEDKMEGMAAFLEKREPQFRDR